MKKHLSHIVATVAAATALALAACGRQPTPAASAQVFQANPEVSAYLTQPNMFNSTAPSSEPWIHDEPVDPAKPAGVPGNTALITRFEPSVERAGDGWKITFKVATK